MQIQRHEGRAAVVLTPPLRSPNRVDSFETAPVSEHKFTYDVGHGWSRLRDIGFSGQRVESATSPAFRSRLLSSVRVLAEVDDALPRRSKDQPSSTVRLLIARRNP